MNDNDAAKRAIEHLVAEMGAAWNRHDAKAYVANFAEDVDYTSVFGILVRGRAAVEQSHAVIFQTMFE